MKKSIKKILSFLTLGVAFLNVSIGVMPESNLADAKAIETPKEQKVVRIDKNSFPGPSQYTYSKEYVVENTDIRFYFCVDDVAINENSFSIMNRYYASTGFRSALDSPYYISNITFKTVGNIDFDLTIKGMTMEFDTFSEVLPKNTSDFNKDIPTIDLNGSKCYSTEVDLCWFGEGTTVEFEYIDITIESSISNNIGIANSETYTFTPEYFKNATANKYNEIYISNVDTKIGIEFNPLAELADTYFALGSNSNIIISSPYDYHIKTIKVVYDESNTGKVDCVARRFDYNYQNVSLDNNVEQTLKADDIWHAELINKGQELVKFKSITITIVNSYLDAQVLFFSNENANFLKKAHAIIKFYGLSYHVVDKVDFRFFAQEEYKVKINNTPTITLEHGIKRYDYEFQYIGGGAIHLFAHAIYEDLFLESESIEKSCNGPTITIDKNFQGESVMNLSKFVFTANVKNNNTNITPTYRWSITCSDPNYEILNNSDKLEQFEVTFKNECSATVKLVAMFNDTAINAQNEVKFTIVDSIDTDINEFRSLKRAGTSTNKYIFDAVIKSFDNNNVTLTDMHSKYGLVVNKDSALNITCKLDAYIKATVALDGHLATLVDYEIINNNPQLTYMEEQPYISPELTAIKYSDHPYSIETKSIRINKINNIQKDANGLAYSSYKYIGTTYIIYITNPDGTNNDVAYNYISEELKKAGGSIAITCMYDCTTRFHEGQQKYAYDPYLIAGSIRVIPKGLIDALFWIDMKYVNPPENTCQNKFPKAREYLLESGYVETFKNMGDVNPIYRRYTAWARALGEDPWSYNKLVNETSIYDNDSESIIISSIALVSTSLFSVVLFMFLKKSKKLIKH